MPYYGTGSFPPLGLNRRTRPAWRPGAYAGLPPSERPPLGFNRRIRPAPRGLSGMGQNDSTGLVAGVTDPLFEGVTSLVDLIPGLVDVGTPIAQSLLEAEQANREAEAWQQQAAAKERQAEAGIAASQAAMAIASGKSAQTKTLMTAGLIGVAGLAVFLLLSMRGGRR